ncbi:MAG: SDR family oxidoreductase [Geminicoccaceae bacterium]
MTGRLVGRVAIVTGAARGIGAAIARRFVEEGAAVVIGDVLEREGEATARALSSTFVRCDVSRTADVEGIVAATLAQHGRLDIFCQNAGIFPLNDIGDIPDDEWDRVLAVNLRGCFLAVRACLPPMKAQGYGRIVLTSSITGPRVVPPQHAHYAASKAGINGLIRAAALETATFGITVNGVEPGNIATEGVAAERSAEFVASMIAAVPMGRMGTPREVANAVLFLASEDASFVTGTTIVVDGGQLLPEGKA